MVNGPALTVLNVNQKANGHARPIGTMTELPDAPPDAEAEIHAPHTRHRQARDYLALRLTSLSPADEWVHEREGDLFVFLKNGAGKSFSGDLLKELSPGDVVVMNATTVPTPQAIVRSPQSAVQSPESTVRWSCRPVAPNLSCLPLS